jgi:hypothetical protein
MQGLPGCAGRQAWPTPRSSARLTLKLVNPDQLIAPVFQPFWRQTIDTWLGRYPVIDDE